MKFRIQLIGFLLIMILRSNVGNAEPLFGLGGGFNVGRHSVQNQPNSDGKVYSEGGLSLNGEIRPSFGIPSIFNPISYLNPLSNIVGQFLGGGQSQRGSQQQQHPSTIAKPPPTSPHKQPNNVKDNDNPVKPKETTDAKDTANDAKETAKDATKTKKDAKETATETAEETKKDTDKKRRRRSLLIYPARTSLENNNLPNPNFNTKELKKNNPRKTRAISANILQEATNLLFDNAETAVNGVFGVLDPSKILFPINALIEKRSISEKESQEAYNKLMIDVIKEVIAAHLLDIVAATIFEKPITYPSQLEVKETANDVKETASDEIFKKKIIHTMPIINSEYFPFYKDYVTGILNEKIAT